ncbi:MAG: Hsp20/alpha crystallin family protein [Deltaproteobacteria bacterium]|nr:Hsp20/alpha crystallin family protein [Deltaproteobacteria bacterium]
MLTLYRDWGFGAPDVTRWFAEIDAAERSLKAALETRAARLSDACGATVRHVLHDQDDALVFRTELPGRSPESVEVTLEADTLTVRAAAARAFPEGYVVRHHGRPAGASSQRISLPCAVDAQAVTATFLRGVLTVTLPKAVPGGPRRIPVTTIDRSTP